jgi:hypothetical protein
MPSDKQNGGDPQIFPKAVGKIHKTKCLSLAGITIDEAKGEWYDLISLVRFDFIIFFNPLFF